MGAGGFGKGQQRLADGDAAFEGLVERGFGGERPADFGAEEVHVLTDLVGVGVLESRRVFAEFSGHAGDDDFAHVAAAGHGEAFRDEVADARERGFGQFGETGFRAGPGAPAGAENHCGAS